MLISVGNIGVVGSVRRRGGAPSWVPAGALAYGNYITGQFWLNRQVVSEAEFLTCTRAGDAWALSSDSIAPFAANEPRITDIGLWVEGAATNVAPRSDAASLGNAAWSGGTLTAPGGGALPGTLVGGFADCREIASSSIQRLLKSSVAHITSGQTYIVSATVQRQVGRYVGIRANVFASGTNVNVGFDLETGEVTFEATNYTGFIRQFGDNFIIGFTVTAGTTSATYSIFSQDTEIAGDTIPAYAGDVDEGIKFGALDARLSSAGIGSPVLNATDSPVTRNADALVTPLAGAGTHPVTLVYSDDTTEVIDDVSAGDFAYPIDPDRPLVKEIVWGTVS